MPESSTIPDRNTSIENSSSSISNTNQPLSSNQDIYEDIGLQNVDVQEVLEEIYQVIADLYQLGLAILQSRERWRLAKNAQRVVDRSKICEETLGVYELPWELVDEVAEDGSKKIRILQVISDQDHDILLEHTRKLNEAQQRVHFLSDPSNLEKLGLENEEAQDTIISRKPSPKGLLAEREANIDPEMPSLEEIRKFRTSRTREVARRWGSARRKDRRLADQLTND